MSKTVVCDYCDKEWPKYSWVEGVRYEFAPKLANGLRRCAYCTARKYLEGMIDTDTKETDPKEEIIIKP